MQGCGGIRMRLPNLRRTITLERRVAVLGDIAVHNRATPKQLGELDRIKKILHERGIKKKNFECA